MLSCINEEGEGGISVVQGYVYKVLHEDDIFPIITITKDTIKSTTGDDSIVITVDTVLKTDTFPAAKTDVYIVYGDEPIYGDKMETGYDGFYRFKYLTKGKYKVFAYSTLTNSRKVPVFDSVTVAYGESKNVRDIYIHEGKSLETSYIKGKVMATYYNKGFAVSVPTAAYGIRVYIRKLGALYQFDEVRTGLDGVFMFQKVEPGKYEVFTLTEDKNSEVVSPVIQSVTVSEKGVIMNIETPFYISITT
jgi:hypothetical protein